MSFSWDFIIASAIVLVLTWAFLSAFSLSTDSLRESLSWAERQRAILFKADALLKTCFPGGIVYCENSLLHSHVSDARANLSFGSGGFCVKRLVLQNNEPRVLVVCS